MIEQKDPINPTYYDRIFDKLIDNKFTQEQLLIVAEFNVFKYIYRWKEKNGIQDLKKARWYLNDLIKKLEKLEENKTNNETK